MMFIRVMRTSKKFDTLNEALKENKITLTNARKIAPILTKENQGFWIQEASKTSENLQTKIATHFPERIKKETVKAISEEYISITIRVKKSDFEKIKRAKELQSKKAKNVVSFEEAIVKSSEVYIEKNDPVEKAKRVTTKRAAAKQNSINSQPVENKQKTKNPLVLKQKSLPPAANIHIVNLRDKGECQNIGEDGKKCKSRDFTEIHHIIHRSKGGTHDPSNLITLCGGHHKALHFNESHTNES